MINKIRIYYSGSESHTYCFWKIFFEVCGIYTIEKKINTQEEVIREGQVLFILGNEHAKLILNSENEGNVYVIKNNSTFKKFQKRRDAIIFRWDEITYKLGAKEKSAVNILKILFNGFEDKKYICRLMQIFIEQQLWGTTWLFQEIARKGSNVFNERIAKVCVGTMDIIGREQHYGKSQYFQFMKIYCSYMHMGVSERSLLKSSENCQKLLVRCSDLSAVGRGWDIPLCLLAGKICTLSVVEEKFALNFYKMASLIEKKSEILYEMGNIYEKIYGDTQRALICYREAYEIDTSHFRALYKLAFENEKQHNWIQALKQYQNILLLLEESNNMITIYEILYLYKVKIRILAIYKKYFIANDISVQHSRDIENFKNTLYEQRRFDIILHCMFGDSEEKEIKEKIFIEIKNKLNETCLEI